jgi:deazaflavin-dependent oxidoreductase (nitroreductase family)
MRPDTLLRRFFRLLNRYIMVPMFRLGFGPFMGTPFTGYIMVLKTTGRKSGKVRYTPVNYAILDGHVYCLAGFGQVAHWYRNLRAQPRIEVILPNGPILGVAEEVTDPAEALRASRQVLRNAGFAGFMAGFNPFTASDDMIREKLAGLPIIRIRPAGVGSGASDPGGWLWILTTALTLWLVLRRPRRR